MEKQMELPAQQTMFKAFYNRDSSFEGIFFVAVKTTGIFCRPTCTARKPKKENLEFFPSTHDALLNGYRPCKICSPIEASHQQPGWLRPLLKLMNDNPDLRLKDADLRKKGFEPSRVRRWFKKHHGMTFQSYLRTLRISQAFGRIRHGDKVIEAAYDSGYESLSGFTESFKKITGFSPVKSQFKKLILISRIPTPFGPMLAGAVDQGICLFEFADRRLLELQLKRLRQSFKAELAPGAHPHFDILNTQIGEYFAGERETFDLPLVLTGTPFQKKVWKTLQTIPYGATRSYGEQAELIGQPAAVRAVARANGDNKIAIIIPCHRVIGSNGKLTGYGGGLWRKRFLLKLEFNKKGIPANF
jgi:AraC family transcriptional regulator of adaptative response/methylated-DNA-[protein]-cysteine methyltransferase